MQYILLVLLLATQVAAQAPASAPAAPPVAVQAPAPSAPAAAPAAAPKAKRTQPLSPRLAPTPAASAVPPPPFRASKAAAGPKDVAHGHETSRDQQAVDNLNPPGTSRMEHRAHISQDLTTEAPKDWRCTEAAGASDSGDHVAERLGRSDAHCGSNSISSRRP